MCLVAKANNHFPSHEKDFVSTFQLNLTMPELDQMKCNHANIRRHAEQFRQPLGSRNRN